VTLIFLPDNRTLVALAGENTIIRWDATTGATLERWTVGEGELKQAILSPDNRTLISALQGGQVGVWDIESGRLLKVLGIEPIGSYVVFSLALSPDGRWVAADTIDGAIRLWDMTTGKIQQTFPGYSDIADQHARNLAFSPDGRLLVSSGAKVRLWLVESGALLREFDEGTGLAFSPDGNLLATGPSQEAIKLWDVSSGELRQTVSGPEHFTTLLFSPDGSTLEAGDYLEGRERMVRLWDLTTGTPAGTLTGFAEVNYPLAISPAGVIFAGHDNDIRVWDIQAGQVTRTLTGHTNRVTNLTISADGKLLVSGERDSNLAWVWDTTTGQRVETIPAFFLGQANTIVLSPDTQMLAVGDPTTVVSIFSVQTGEVLHELRVGIRGTDYLSFSPDSAILVSGTQGNLNVWDVKTGRLLFSPGLGVAAFLPNGQLVIIEENVASFWQAETGKRLRTLPCPWPVNSVIASPDGRLLASTFFHSNSGQPLLVTGTVHLWEAETGRLLRTIETPAAVDIYFTPDGKLLIMYLRGATVQHWGIPPK
jgi:WD40 repeat protein